MVPVLLTDTLPRAHLVVENNLLDKRTQFPPLLPWSDVPGRFLSLLLSSRLTETPCYLTEQFRLLILASKPPFSLASSYLLRLSVQTSLGRTGHLTAFLPLPRAPNPTPPVCRCVCARMCACTHTHTHTLACSVFMASDCVLQLESPPQSPSVRTVPTPQVRDTSQSAQRCY